MTTSAFKTAFVSHVVRQRRIRMWHWGGGSISDRLANFSMSHHLSQPIICADGFQISVQASKSHYCTPRSPNPPNGEWESFELGFPSQADDLIRDYAEDADSPTNTVYPQVPADVVFDLIEKHGGLA